MNNGNDNLHGNIDPYKQIVEDVWFDQRFIPLFATDEALVKRTMKYSCENVTPQNSLESLQTVSNMIELVPMAMDNGAVRGFTHLMQDGTPGINKKTKRLENLFPVDHYAEAYGSFSTKTAKR